MSRRQLIFALLLTVTIVLGSEWLAVAGPFNAGLVLLWDVSAYADAALGVVILAGSTRLRPFIATAANVIRRRSARPRAVRTRRTHRPSADNDSSGPPSVLAA